MRLVKRATSLRQSVITLVLFLGVSSIGWVQKEEMKRLHTKSEISTTENNTITTEKLQKQLESIKHMPSLGFRNFLANSVFLSFLQYFSGVSERNTASRHLSPMFFEVILSLEPFYKDYYLFLSSSTTLYAAQPQQTVDLMSRGLKAIDPRLIHDSFYIWRYRGVDELLFLGDSQAAKKSFQKSAEWAKLSDLPESELVGTISQQTAEFLKTDPDSQHAQISAWGSILATAVNDTIRSRAIEQIRSLNESVGSAEAHTKVSPTEENGSSLTKAPEE